MKSLSTVIKKVLMNLKRTVFRDQRYGLTVINTSRSLRNFWPNTSGSYRKLSRITLSEINEIFPLLDSFGDQAERKLKIQPDLNEKNFHLEVELLGNLLFGYGSDKSRGHDYHQVYAQLLDRKTVMKVLEIGIGSNNTAIPSNMGTDGVPGASLRAFRDFFPNAEIYGMDYDKEILFQDTRISTFQIDQTDLNQLEMIDNLVGADFDLMIDDGLHSLKSSLNSLKVFLRLVRIGGFVVIEDIPDYSVHVYNLVAKLIYPHYQSSLVPCRGGNLLVVRRQG